MMTTEELQEHVWYLLLHAEAKDLCPYPRTATNTGIRSTLIHGRVIATTDRTRYDARHTHALHNALHALKERGEISRCVVGEAIYYALPYGSIKHEHRLRAAAAFDAEVARLTRSSSKATSNNDATTGASETAMES
jgi:hypothetical protein